MSVRVVPWWLWVIVAGSLVLVNPYVRGDGNGYYAWLVSPVIDHDFDFENQYRHGDPFFKPLMFETDGRPRESMKTPTGRLPDQWSVGPAVLWAPWFLTAHAAVQVSHLWHSNIPADGYSWPYRYAVAIGTAIYGWLALWFSWKAAVIIGRGAGAASAVLLVWLATPLIVYQYFLPFHVHALSAFAVACYVYQWLRQRPIDRLSVWACWGALAGLMTMVYQLNAVLLVISAYELIMLIGRRGIPHACKAGIVFSCALIVVWTPQLIGKSMVYGTALTTGYPSAGDTFYWTSPRLWQTAFSAEHGLFSWTPVALIALIGLVVAARKRHEPRVVLASAVLFFYAVASYQNWHGQSSFGNRFFLSLVIFAVLGLAEVATWALTCSRPVQVAAVSVAILLGAWNIGLAIQWGTDIVPNRGPVDFRVVARNQVTEVPREAWHFLRLYFSSRDQVYRSLEDRDMHDGRHYKLIR